MPNSNSLINGTQMFKIILSVSLIQLLTLGAFCGAYVFDADTPLHLTDTYHSWTMPTRLSIYVTMPREYGGRTYYDYNSLQTHRPVYSSTNNDEITGLISLLQQEDYAERITNINKTVVVAYHILLFRDSNMTVMHYRIFQPVAMKSDWCRVYPVTSTGFFYHCKTIGAWLHARIKHPERLP